MSEACAKLEQVRGCNAVEEHRLRQQHIPEEDQPGHAQRTRSKMEDVKQYVKEQGDTPPCNVNTAEKGTVMLDEDQGEVPTAGEDRDTEKESDHPEHPSHAALRGPCQSNSFGEILWITRRQSQLESEPCEAGWSHPSDDMDPR